MTSLPFPGLSFYEMVFRERHRQEPGDTFPAAGLGEDWRQPPGASIFMFYKVEPMGEHELGMVTIDSEIDQVSIFEGIDDKSLCRIFIL